ncbi:MAG: HYR domain-containing protein [Bacteroidetes bacterium]|nr:HYR domain-containing protein [Bacteroidota bacterium]
MRFKIYISVALVMVLLLCSFDALFAQNRTTLDQIQLLLNEKASRTPAQKKMDSRLLQAVKEKRGEKMVAGVDLLPANVNADAQSNVEVDIYCNVSKDLLNKIISLGGVVENSFSQYKSIRAKINLSKVETLAANSDVISISPAAPYETVGTGFKDLPVTTTNFFNFPTVNSNAAKSSLSFEQRAERVKEKLNNYLKNQKNLKTTLIGTVTSQGDLTHRTSDVRNIYGYSGEGIKVGVLSDSYDNRNGAAQDVLNGDLPGVGNPFGNTTPVTVVQEGGTNDEGRAMLQIVHDLAPKAQLFFATGNGGPGNFANNIIQLRNTYHCDIIIDDLSYFNEPVFEDGTVAQAVNNVTANGCLYFSSAANSGSVLRGSAGVWEGDFNDAGSLPFTGGSKVGTIHNFGTISSPLNGDIITVAGSQLYTLAWSDKTGSSSNDYDLFLVSASGTVKAASTTVQNGSGAPYEQINVPALVSGDRLVVFKAASAQVRAISINTNRGRLTLATTGQTHGHASCIDAFCVAATPAAGSADGTFPGPFPGPYVSTNRVEYFSSDGPRKVFYNPDGTPVTPGNFLFGTNGGTTRQKPDITAADGVVTTLPASSGLNPFYGTSAAAPHAGAIAALLKSAKPSLTPAQIRTALTSTALDIEGSGYDINSGYGILQAFQAMQSINPTLISNINLGTVTATEGSFGNGNGAVEPGELGKLDVQLLNPSLATATSVTATISTTTPGITITQPNATYGNIASNGNAMNNVPYLFGVSPTIACGSLINFKITVTFGGGGNSPMDFLFTVRVGKQVAPITSTIGATPPTGVGYTATSGQMGSGRIARADPASTCAANKPYPGLTGSGNRQYDAYTFTNANATAQCITVTMNTTVTGALYIVAYNNNGFVPTSPGTNYLADAGLGQSGPTETMAFNVPAGQSYTVVVHDINVLPASGLTYTLNVSQSNCSAPPVCTPITVAPATIPPGTIGTPYSQVFTATGGSGSYNFNLTGTLPTGLSFAGSTLSGTPTQSGSFPITVNAVDAAGCTTGTMNYTLQINVVVGPPAAITAVAGTPQTALPNTAFANLLKAKVTDASSIPVSGATVTFTAPASGASGTFPGPAATATAVTDANGIATAPTFTANANLGSYNVVATVTGVATGANFALTNANAPCVITCPSNITVNATAGQCGALVTYPAPTSTGTCGAITSSPASGSFFPVGTTTVNVSSGSSTCSFTVTVKDAEPPVISCPADITKNTDPNLCSAVVNFNLPTATDNCSGVVTVTSVPASGSVFAKGTTPVTVTAKDAAGNTSTCTFNVIVKDVQAPVITCPANINTTSTIGACTAVVNFTVNATDNCPGVTVTSVPASGSTFASGTTTVTSTAKDAAGNTSTCSFTVTVTDGQVPVISQQPVNTSVCVGQNAVFSVTATNAVTYQWQVNANGSWVNVPSSNSATLTIPNVTNNMNFNQYRVLINGICTNIVSNAAVLNTRPSPVVVLTASPFTSINPGTSSVLFSTVSPVGNYSYVYKKDGVVVPSFTTAVVPLSVDGLGTYQVTVTDLTTQCSGTSNLVKVKDSASSNLFVYPNPTTDGKFQVRYYNAGGVSTSRTMNVFDARGEIIFTKQYQSSAIYQKMDVNISNLSSGVYMIEVRDASGTRLASGKLVKN